MQHLYKILADLAPLCCLDAGTSLIPSLSERSSAKYSRLFAVVENLEPWDGTFVVHFMFPFSSSSNTYG